MEINVIALTCFAAEKTLVERIVSKNKFGRPIVDDSSRLAYT